MLVQTLPYADFVRECGFEGRREAMLRQLGVDVPRQTTLVDGRPCGDAEALLASVPDPLAQFCTQAALSWTYRIFHEAYADLPVRAVTDGARAVYAVDTAAGSLSIEKTFEVIAPSEEGRTVSHIRCTTDVRTPHGEGAAAAGVLVSWYVYEVPSATTSPCGCVVEDWFGPGGWAPGKKVFAPNAK